MLVSVLGETVANGVEIEVVLQRTMDALPGADKVGGSPTWPSEKSESEMLAVRTPCAMSVGRTRSLVYDGTRGEATQPRVKVRQPLSPRHQTLGIAGSRGLARAKRGGKQN